MVHPGEQGQETEGLGKVFFFKAGLEIFDFGLVPAFVAGIEFQERPSHRASVAVDIDTVESGFPFFFREDVEPYFSGPFPFQ